MDNSLIPHEEFIGLYKTDSITSQALVTLINDMLLRLGLTIDKCQGQYYDGANSMSGSRFKQCKVIKHSLELYMKFLTDQEFAKKICYVSEAEM